MKKKSWVVVANSAQARLFKLDNLALSEMDSLVHAESRMHGIDLTTDKSGNNHEGIGSGHAALEKQFSPKKHEAIIFAKQLAAHLDHARSSGEIDKLFLAASPSFLGLLRQEMNVLTANLVVAEVDKDITHLKTNEIIKHFPIGL